MERLSDGQRIALRGSIPGAVQRDDRCRRHSRLACWRDLTGARHQTEKARQLAQVVEAAISAPKESRGPLSRRIIVNNRAVRFL
jgi:hypothetical protein